MKDRREFLKKFTIGTSSMLLFKNPWEYQKFKSGHLFLNESNILPSLNGPAVIGIIHLSSPMLASSAIKRIRIKHQYRRELKYRSRDEKKYHFTKDLIDYFFNDPDLSFYARIVNGDISKSNYRINYRKAITDVITIKRYRKLDFNLGTSYLPMEKYIQTNFKALDDIQFTESYFDLFQLSDFFSGCIYGDEVELGNETKIQLLNYLKNKLKVGKLTELYNLDKGNKFKITIGTN